MVEITTLVSNLLVPYHLFRQEEQPNLESPSSSFFTLGEPTTSEQLEQQYERLIDLVEEGGQEYSDLRSLTQRNIQLFQDLEGAIESFDGPCTNLYSKIEDVSTLILEKYAISSTTTKDVLKETHEIGIVEGIVSKLGWLNKLNSRFGKTPSKTITNTTYSISKEWKKDDRVLAILREVYDLTQECVSTAPGVNLAYQNFIANNELVSKELERIDEETEQKYPSKIKELTKIEYSAGIMNSAEQVSRANLINLYANFETLLNGS